MVPRISDRPSEASPPSTNIMSARFALLPLLVLSSACISAPIGQEQVTPQRPTISYDTKTTSFGTFEFEAGLSVDPGDRFDTPTTLKYGSGEATEVSIGWSPYLKVDMPTGDESGIGDVVLGIRHRMWDETDSVQSLAVQALVKLPAADETEGLGTGEIDASFGGSLSRTLAYDTTVVAHYLLDFIGNPTDSDDIGHTVALSVSAPVLREDVTGWIEIGGHMIPELDSEVVLGQIGAAYSPHPTLSYDAAVSIGLTDESDDFALLIGLTTNLGLYSPRPLRPEPE